MIRARSASVAPIRRRDAGFSAVELMIALAMFGILMLGFLSLFPLGMRTVDRGKKLTVASSLVQDEIERLKTLPASDADLAAGAHADAANPLFGFYTRTWTVTDDLPMAGMKTVNLTVSYVDKGIPRNVQVSTYLAP
jgi:prepilin-type N-terminal cleavage/methylation domain-containing protein